MRMFLATCAAFTLLGACAQQPSAPAPLEGDALIARGQYLATSIGGCNDCHTPMTPQGPDMTKSLQGADLIFKPTIEIPWAPHAPSIAGLPEGWSDAQFEHFMQTGERPNGVPVNPPMPAFRLNAEDAHALGAYIKTLPRAQQ